MVTFQELPHGLARSANCIRFPWVELVEKRTTGVEEGGSAYHAEYMPDGSVWYNLGTLSPLSNPTINVLIPNGLTPPLCVYRCCTPATYFVIYSMVTGSSTVNRWDWASNLALSTKIRASALSPAKARHTWVSIRPIFEGVIRVSCSFIADRFSQPRTTMSLPLTPTAHVPVLLVRALRILGPQENKPRFTASRAYSTWKTWPSGLWKLHQRRRSIRA